MTADNLLFPHPSTLSPQLSYMQLRGQIIDIPNERIFPGVIDIEANGYAQYVTA